MHGTPNAADALIGRDDLLGADLDILGAAVSQQELHLLRDLLGRHVLDADGLGAAVDVVRHDDRVVVRPRRDAELHAGEFVCQFGERGRAHQVDEAVRRDPVVAVGHGQSSALEDVGADAVLLGIN